VDDPQRRSGDPVEFGGQGSRPSHRIRSVASVFLDQPLDGVDREIAVNVRGVVNGTRSGKSMRQGHSCALLAPGPTAWGSCCGGRHRLPDDDGAATSIDLHLGAAG
jgi:hypothetical protein